MNDRNKKEGRRRLYFWDRLSHAISVFSFLRYVFVTTGVVITQSCVIRDVCTRRFSWHERLEAHETADAYPPGSSTRSPSFFPFFFFSLRISHELKPENMDVPTNKGKLIFRNNWRPDLEIGFKKNIIEKRTIR